MSHQTPLALAKLCQINLQSPLFWCKVEYLPSPLDVYAPHKVMSTKAKNEKCTVLIQVAFTTFCLSALMLEKKLREQQVFPKFSVPINAIEINGLMLSSLTKYSWKWMVIATNKQTPTRDESVLCSSLVCSYRSTPSTVEKFILEYIFVCMIKPLPPQYSILFCLWQQQGHLGKIVFNIMLVKACQIIYFPTWGTLPQQTSHRKPVFVVTELNKAFVKLYEMGQHPLQQEPLIAGAIQCNGILQVQAQEHHTTKINL